jgi:hypothetical protein
MVFSGGGSLLAGFPGYVAAKTGMDVITDIHLPTNGKCHPPAIWAIAAGLACAGAGTPPRKCAISFLPASVREEQVFRREKPFWFAASVAAALILIVSLAGGYGDFKRMEKHLNAQRASLERRRALVAQIEAAQARGNLIREMATPVDNLLHIGPNVREILSIVAAAKDPGDWITLVCDGESYQAKSPSAALFTPLAVGLSDRRRHPTTTVSEALTNKPPQLEHVIIEGLTPKLNFSTVQSLIDHLAAADLITVADLLSDDKLAQMETGSPQGADRRTKRFVIDVKVENP